MTDEQLVARYVAARDPDDFRLVVERNAPHVLRLVSSILGPFRDTDAEETTQDVFVRVHERLDQFRGESRFATWLYRVAYRVALNRARAARLRLPHVADDALHALAADDDPRNDVLTSERASLLAAAIESLPDLYRSVVYLHYWQETTVDEISCLLDIPPNTIKSYLFRARERIARALAAKGITS